MELKFDTKKLNDVGDDLKKEANQLITLFDSLYSKLNSMQKDGVWLGYASDHFLNNISGHSVEMKDLCMKIKEFGDILNDFAEKNDKLIKKYRGEQ